MSTIWQIANMTTTLKRNELDQSAVGYHESLLRSYHIVAKLRSLLEQGTPNTVILEILDLMEGKIEQGR